MRETDPNLRLQVGRRYMLNNGSRFGRGLRVYRVIDASETILPASDLDYEIEWEVIRAIRREDEAYYSQDEYTENSELDGDSREQDPIDWKEKIEMCAREAIDLLIESGVDPSAYEAVTQIDFRKTGRGAVGTDTNYKRAQQSGIVRNWSAAKSEGVRLCDAVAMMLLNAHRDIFRNKARRNEAMEIITMVTNEYSEKSRR